MLGWIVECNWSYPNSSRKYCFCCFSFCILSPWFNQLQPGVAYIYPLKTSENLKVQKRPQSCNFIKKETLAQVFSGEFCEIIFNCIFFTEHLWTTASEGRWDCCLNNWRSFVLRKFITVISFYTPWKHQKTFGFLMFSGVIEIQQWLEMAYSHLKTKAIK